MGRGSTVYKEDYIEDRGELGIFVPTSEIMPVSDYEKRTFSYACKGFFE